MSYCVIQTRQEISEIEKHMFEYVQSNCVCCNFCFHCKLLIKLKKEIARTGFNSFNSDIKYWSVDWFTKEEHNLLPKYYILDGYR